MSFHLQALVGSAFVLALVAVALYVGSRWGPRLQRARAARHDSARAASLEAARRVGLDFTELPSGEPHEFLTGLGAAPLGNEGTPGCYHLFQGAVRGIPVIVTTYVYRHRSEDADGGPSTKTVALALAVARAGPGDWPRLTLRPEGAAQKLKDALGADDIDFESEEFSRRYWVQCQDRAFAYAMLHPRMMELLLEPGWDRWEVHREQVCAWKPGPLELAEAAAVADRLVRFVELVPAHLRRPAEAAAGHPRGPLAVEESA